MYKYASILQSLYAEKSVSGSNKKPIRVHILWYEIHICIYVDMISKTYAKNNIKPGNNQ